MAEPAAAARLIAAVMPAQGGEPLDPGILWHIRVMRGEKRDRAARLDQPIQTVQRR
jgi:hypothetical protein